MNYVISGIYVLAHTQVTQQNFYLVVCPFASFST